MEGLIYIGIVTMRDGSEWRSEPKTTKEEAISAAMFRIQWLRRKRDNAKRVGDMRGGAPSLYNGVYVLLPDGTRERVQR